MGVEGDVDLVVHIKPFRMVVQFLSLQGHSCDEAKSPVEGFEMELLEDDISAFCPLSTKHVCFASQRGEQQVAIERVSAAPGAPTPVFLLNPIEAPKRLVELESPSEISGPS